jgi:hypothetical protein
VAGVGALALRIAREEGLSPGTSLLAGLLASGPPLAAFALHIYTEAAATLALFAAYALLRFGRGSWPSGFAAALACALPFLHPRMALVSVAIAFVALVYRKQGSFRVFALTSAVGLMIYDAFWTSVYGVPTALGAYGGVPEDAAFNPLRAGMGLLIDRAYGLLPYAPAFAAFLFLATPRPKTLDGPGAWRAEVALVLAILLPALLWRMWWGGQSPPARLIAPLTPFLALWVARGFNTARPVVRHLILAALTWSWALFLFAALQPGRLLFINRRTRPTRIWDALWPGGPLDAALPDLARPVTADWWIAGVWLVGLIVAVFAVRGARLRASNRV